ncbi:MAG TPA: PQQ-dependent dehydrogenase, methanol/ethanol family [Vicinamibacterales bacterium]|nr:PQQ-dependent dehydrogenase, methanol/ethanol family [Vicinamibacterales bacterium]
MRRLGHEDTKTRRRLLLWITLLVALSTDSLRAQVAPDRLVNAAREPQNWLTYSGGYFSNRYSALTQITPANAKTLDLKWMYQAAVAGAWQTTPLVVDAVMYLTQRPNDVVALDAKTGRVFWIYRYNIAGSTIVCCGANNRGLAILGDTLFMGTLDAHLVAIDAKSGRPLWNTEVATSTSGYSLTLAPLVVKDKVVVGVGGGEYGIRGFVAAFDARTGKEAWRFYTIPGPGDAGFNTWQQCPPADRGAGAPGRDNDKYCDAEAWKHGGGSVWVTGSYDPALNLTYWGVGNAGPDWNADQRPGDNLYTDSVVALDADTGRVKWHYQFTPHDRYDYDSVQVPVLADINWRGAPVKAMVWANRNGNFYVLERETGKFLVGKPFVKVNWMDTFDERGRPHQTPQPAGQPTWPGNQGGTNWYSPSFSPRTGLFYVSAWEGYATIFGGTDVQYQEGRNFGGGANRSYVPVPGAPAVPGLRRGPINNWTEAAATGAVLAIDAATGDQKWKFPMTDVTDSGILTTACDVLFTGGREGYFQALDARTGTLLWKTNLGAQIVNGPITYQVDGVQYVATISGLSLCVFALR